MKPLKPYNGGQWTNSRFNSFIKGALRAAARRWPPKHVVKKAAWVSRGIYRCAGFECEPHNVPISLGTVTTDTREYRENNVFVDHMAPVIDPIVGFISWDDVVMRMFVERDGLQILCRKCHKNKTSNERNLAKKSKVS